MGLSTGEVAGLPNGGGVTTEEAPKRENPAPYKARGWGFMACAFALHAPLFGPLLLAALVSERG